MPTNAGVGYSLALEDYNKAKTNEEKIKALERVYSEAPKHKSAEKLLQEIKNKLSKLRAKAEKERSKKGGSSGISIKKEGAAQVTVVGLTNSGKSTILKNLTNAKIEIAEYGYTTKNPEIGVMDYNGIKIQLIELPSLFEGFSYSEKCPSLMGVIRASDLVVIVLDGTRDCATDLEIIKKEFDNSSIKLRSIKDKDGMNCLFVVNKVLRNFKCKYRICWIDDLKEAIWGNLGLIYVYTKQPGKEKELPPVALKKGSTVQELASIVHKDFVKGFKYARVWGKSVKYFGLTVGLDHKLQENDIVEFHTK